VTSHGEQPGDAGRSRGPSRESDRLLRAIEELRALERERRMTAGRPFDELERRVEAKAREVFRIAGGADEGARRPS
jgi:hypothetical protein